MIHPRLPEELLDATVHCRFHGGHQPRVRVGSSATGVAVSFQLGKPKEIQNILEANQYIISISTFYCGWELRMMRMHRWYGPILAISLKQGMYSVLSFACWLGVPSLSPSISWDPHHPHFDVSHTHTYIIFICMYTYIYICIYIRMCFCIYIHISWSQKMFGFFICWAQNTGMGHGSRPWHPVSFTPGTFPKRWVPAVALGPQLPRAERGHQVVTAWYDERWLGNGLFIDDLHMKNGDSMGL